MLRTLSTQYLTHQVMQHSNVDSSAKHAVCSYILLISFRRDSLTSLNNFKNSMSETLFANPGAESNNTLVKHSAMLRYHTAKYQTLPHW